MIVAALILILSTGTFFFYLQVTCQRILRRRFDQEYFRSIVNANRLEFPSLQKSLEEFGAPPDYSRLRRMLRCDYLALTYLLKHVANVRQSYSNEERLLVLYFRWQLLSLALRCLLNVSQKKPILKLTSVLQYFANVIGQRISTVKFANLTADDYLRDL